MAKQYLMPYTNLHELNLDWLINAMKQLEASWEGTKMNVTATASATAGTPTVKVSGSLKDTLNFDFGLPEGNSYPSDTIPKVDNGNGEVGTEATFARGDHVHPSDTTKLDKVSYADETVLYAVMNDKQITLPYSGFATSTEVENIENNISRIQTSLEHKQDTLISGTNIKTINNNDIIGSGNLKTLLNLETVWENTNQDTFEAQTIQLDLSKYQAILITCLCLANNTASGFISVLLPLSVESTIRTNVTNSAGACMILWRTIFPQQSQITFQSANCCLTSSNYTATNNMCLIPITIYGV